MTKTIENLRTQSRGLQAPRDGEARVPARSNHYRSLPTTAPNESGGSGSRVRISAPDYLDKPKPSHSRGFRHLRGRLAADRPAIGAWEKFRREFVPGGKVALRASGGHYVSVQP